MADLPSISRNILQFLINSYYDIGVNKWQWGKRDYNLMPLHQVENVNSWNSNALI